MLYNTVGQFFLKKNISNYLLEYFAFSFLLQCKRKKSYYLSVLSKLTFLLRLKTVCSM